MRWQRIWRQFVRRVVGERVPTWVKVVYLAFVAVLLPTWIIAHGWVNLLWFSDVALLLGLVAAWLESRRLASMMAVGVLLAELGWNLDFLAGLLVGWHPLGIAAYMFDAEEHLFVRAMSLFHVPLVVVLVWLVYRLGYDARAWRWQVVLGWVVLLVTYLITEPERNINWAFGPGNEPQDWMPPIAWLGVMFVIYPVLVVLPMHGLLRAVMPRRVDRRRRSE